MPKIKIEKVLTFSSEDTHHPASNILNPDPSKKWKCAHTGEKRASIVLQLDKATKITAIDIGNENSAYIEVLVSRSSTDEFKHLIGMSSFMSPFEARQHQNINKVRMFSGDDLSSPECNEKWDLVKFICIQPYNKSVQYGISFVTLHTNGEDSVTDKRNVGRFTLRPDSPSSINIGSLFLKQKESLSESNLRGAAAIREASSKPSISPYKAQKLKKVATPSPKPSTSRVVDDEEDEVIGKDRRRQSLLYDDDDVAPNEKIDRLIAKKKQGDELKEKTRNSEDKKKTSKKNDDSKKRKYENETTKDESPQKRAAKEVLKDCNTDNIPGPSRKHTKKRHSSEENTSESPKKKNKLTVKGPISRPYDQLLEDVTFVISGIQNPERANLRTSAMAMGAKYKADWGAGCTHLICAFVNTPKFNQVKGKGKIVKRDWIKECERQKKRLPWRRFCLDRNDNTGNESEEEIWEQNETSKTNEVDIEFEASAGTDEEIERIQKQQNNNQAITSTVKKNSSNVGKVENDDEVEYPSEMNNRNGDLPTLPNYFSNMKFYLSENLGRVKKELSRYIIAYNGTIIEDYIDVDDNVFGIIFSEYKDEVDKLKKNTSKIVSPCWLLECHNKKRFIPYDEFLIQFSGTT